MPAASVPISLPWIYRSARVVPLARSCDQRPGCVGVERAGALHDGLGQRVTGQGRSSPRCTSEPGFVRWSKVDGAVGLSGLVHERQRSAGSSRPSRTSPTSVSTTGSTSPAHACSGASEHCGGSTEPHRTGFRHFSTEPGATEPYELPSCRPAPRTRLSSSRCPTLFRWAQTPASIELVPAFVFSTATATSCTACTWQPTRTASMSSTSVLRFGGNTYAPRSTGRMTPQSFTMQDQTPAEGKRVCSGPLLSAERVPPALHLSRPTFSRTALRSISGTTIGPVGGTTGQLSRSGPTADAELPQFACQAGRRGEFKKTSVKPDLADGLVPFATGLYAEWPSLGRLPLRARSLLRRIARHVEASSSRSRVRHSVEPRRGTVENRRSDADLLYVGRPSAQAGHMAVPRTRHQRLAAREPGDELDDPVKLRIAAPTFRVVRG